MNKKHLLVIGLLCALTASARSYGADEAQPAPATAPAQENAIAYSVTDELVTIRATDVPVQDVLDRLLKDFPIDLEIPEAIRSQKVSLDLQDVTVDKVIESLAGSQALVFERVGEGYRLVAAQLTTHQDYIAPTLDKLERKEQRNVAAKEKQAKKVLAKFGSIYTDAGELNYDQAKALIQERNAKVQALVDDLAALGPGGARALSGIYKEYGTREQLAMIDALRMMDDEEAARVLGQLFGEEDQYSVLRAIVSALNGRSDADIMSILKNILASTSDVRLRAPVAKGLGNWPGAMDLLVDLLMDPKENMDVRKEVITAIGQIGTEEARDALMKVASQPGDLLMRKTAILELGRAFEDRAVPQLQVLLKDPDEGIRQSAIRALSHMGTNQALALLRTAATSDVSSVIRAHAEAALANHGAGTTPN